MIETIEGHLYDYPKYYDVLFGSEWREELDFLVGAFDQFSPRPVSSVFEPACGTGRLLVRLAKAGYQVSGVDLNKPAVDYCNDRLERQGFDRSAFVGDMTSFKLPRKVGAAFNLINGFRHLLSEQQAIAHLNCVAHVLPIGGLYVLGLHLTPKVGTPLQKESWTARRGSLRVTTRMWTLGSSAKQRIERVGFTYHVHTPSKNFRVADEIHFRTYTRSQFLKLIGKIETLEIAATFDFDCDIDTPVEIDDATQDAIFILRKC